MAQKKTYTFVGMVRYDSFLRLICLGVLRLFCGLLLVCVGLISWKLDTYYSHSFYNCIFGAIHIFAGILGFLCTKACRNTCIIGLHTVLSFLLCAALYPSCVGVGAMELWCDAGGRLCVRESYDDVLVSRSSVAAVEVTGLGLESILLLINMMATVGSMRAYRIVRAEQKRRQAIHAANMTQETSRNETVESQLDDFAASRAARRAGHDVTTL